MFVSLGSLPPHQYHSDFLYECYITVVSGWLGTPTNVRLTSYNMDLVLRWDPPVEGASGLVYTAEYK